MHRARILFCAAAAIIATHCSHAVDTSNGDTGTGDASDGDASQMVVDAADVVRDVTVPVDSSRDVVDVADVQQTGLCAHVTCTRSDACHGIGVCDPTNGMCSNPVAPAGTTCDDGNACTQADTCQNGACVGANPIVCTAGDTCHVAGVCDTTTGVCSTPNANDGTACDDSNACTHGDSCHSGACVAGTTTTCAALDGCHTAGTCDPTSGTCTNPAANNGTACSDGNSCTQSDSCQSGICVGSNPVVCSSSDQCHPAGTCDPTTGVCSNPSAPDGSTCNDGNACTRTDTCQTGVCTGSNSVSCTALDSCHAAGTCNPISGVCSNPNAPNGTACTDGNACTQTDTCQSGTCLGMNPVFCTAVDDCHNAGACNPATGVCTNPSAADGSFCNDGNACTQSDACQFGTCVGSSPVSCTQLDSCHTTGTCDPSTGTCSNPIRANGTACNDGNACTRTDTCSGGTCTGTNPVVCTALDQCHSPGTCSPATGMCSNPVVPGGTACNDGNACTINDQCSGIICQGIASPEQQDQSQTSFDTGWSPGLGPIWQEFRVGVAGRLTRLSIYKNGQSGTQSITLNVHTGSGVGGPIIYTGAFVLPNVTNQYDIVIGGTGPVLVAGQQYTWEIRDPSNSLGTLVHSNNPYPNGTSGAAGFNNSDFWFITYSTPVCP